LQWWSDENTKGRHLWPGLNTVAVKASNKATEIAREIEVSRNILGNDAGEVHYSIAGISKNYEMQQELKNNVYKDKVLIPETTWLTSKPLSELRVDLKKQGDNVSVNWTKNKDALSYVIYLKYGNIWQTEIVSPDINAKTISTFSNGKKLTTIVVRYADKLGKLSSYKVVSVTN